MDSSISELPSEKQTILKQFKLATADIIKPGVDDFELIKWLTARCFDLAKAEQMFRESVIYKEKMNADTLINEYTTPEVLQKYFANGQCGYDKEGSPVVVELFGRLDIRGLMMSLRKSDFERNKLWQCELIMQFWKKKSQELGRRVDGISVIFDMEGCGTKSLWRPGLQMYLHIVKVLEDNYPEMLKRMFIVNAPSIFPLLYKVCKPLVSDDMRRKIHVLSASDHSVMLEYIDADQLPRFLGGKLTDPDGNPRCVTKICPGGEVPHSYYLSEAVNGEEMETVLIPYRDSVKFEFKVTVLNSILRWEFRTEDYNISYRITFLSDGRILPEDVVPIRHVDSHLVTEDDSITCDRLGTYTVIFDNTSSWMTSKKLTYHIELYSTDDVTEIEVMRMNDISEMTSL